MALILISCAFKFKITSPSKNVQKISFLMLFISYNYLIFFIPNSIRVNQNLLTISKMRNEIPRVAITRIANLIPTFKSLL